MGELISEDDSSGCRWQGSSEKKKELGDDTEKWKKG